jgi:predicted TIM-barrel fold metal-dependent hydrolase
MIWDLHTHLTPHLRGDTIPEKAGHLLEVGARLGIERMCIFMGMKWERDPSPESLREQNDDILEAVAAHPQSLTGFVYLNPKHVDSSLDELKRCVRDGPMAGIKLWVAHRCSEPELDPIVEYATELDIPIFQHTWLKTSGNLPGESTPADVAALAKRHPKATLVCGHSGGKWQEAFPVIRNCPNVSVGLAGFDPTADVTETAVRELGADRVLFGSDAPGRSFASQLGKVSGAEISDRDKEKILSGNLRKILEPVLKKKGFPV